MLKPGEHKSVQSRSLAYGQDIGLTVVPRKAAKRRRGFGTGSASLFFDEVLHRQVTAVNPDYADPLGSLVGQLHRLRVDIYENRDLLTYLRNGQTHYVHEPLHRAVPNHGAL